jgi:hypothetical protein
MMVNAAVKELNLRSNQLPDSVKVPGKGPKAVPLTLYEQVCMSRFPVWLDEPPPLRVSPVSVETVTVDWA